VERPWKNFKPIPFEAILRAGKREGEIKAISAKQRRMISWIRSARFDAVR
jgi:hypothetical protein